jgi:hypothetical protein
MIADVDVLKRACPMPSLLHKIGLGEFARRSCRSPFREDKKPSWGIFQRDRKWFWKDHGNGDGGDEITLLARWKGLDEKRDFHQLVKLYADLSGVHLNGETPQASRSSQSREDTRPFDWPSCVAAVRRDEIQELAQWRGYSPELCAWLKEENAIGLRDGNWALPVHGEAGTVIACHYRVDRGGGEKPDWFYHPKGFGARPLVFGDPKRTAIGFVFESYWDAFAVMDSLGWHKPKGIPDTAVVITRGAGNGKLVAGLFSPQTAVYVFRQNDEAAEKWLADVCAHTGSKVFHVATPTQFKDVNDWTRAGATGAEIMAAIQDATPVDSAAPRIQAAKPEQGAEYDLTAPIADWPKPLEAAALHGVAGELVNRLDPHTEADPAAILFQFLVAFGNLIGRTAHFTVEAHKHFCNMNAVLVGNTSKARKGISWGRVRALLEAMDSAWKRPASGMSTGEGMIWAVRDPVIKRNSKGEDETVDEGVADKRLLSVEEEFSRVLKCANREHNTLSAVFRQAFDTGNLRILTKSNPAEATGAHISVIGHITRQELIRHLTNTECANGFANRILWVCVRRSKELPEGGNAHLLDFSDLEARLKKALAYAQTCGELRRDREEAREFWHSIYHDLSAPKPGLCGAVTSRAEAYVVRLSLVYAVLDCADFIRREHLEAALAAWRFCDNSARYIFGDSLGDPDADAVLAALREAGAAGLTRTEINERVFKRNHTKAEIERALNHLAELGLAEAKSNPTEGRSAERWFSK